MTTTAEERTSELQQLDQDAVAELEAEEAARAAAEEEALAAVPANRLAAVVAFSTIACSMLVGGIFVGVTPRIWAVVGGMLGIVLAVRVRMVRNPLVMNLLMAGGLAAIGIVLAVPGGSFSDVVNLGPFVREAVTSGDVLRPPVEFTLGWRAILGWLMGGVGFAGTWVAVELRRASLGLMVPLPIVAISAISVPADAKLASGIAAIALFAIGLGMLSGIEVGAEAEQRSVAFELRRASRALPLIAVITVVLYLLARANFLFPPPLYDPTQSAQKPKTVPLTEVPDRVLFTVQASITGPWRTGGLDVYDGLDWRLPPFAENRLAEVPPTGIVDSELTRGIRAKFDIKDLGGAVLPGLPNLVGVVAEKAPPLAYDSRTGNLRLAQGQVQAGLVYSVTAARVPTVQELQQVSVAVPGDVRQFLEIPDPPPAVQNLIRRAPASSSWDRFDFVRQELLRTVVATGEGAPVSVPPEKVADMLTGSREGSPFEIVAAQAMLARWVGIPARIGYGFDGGDRVGEFLEVRPRHGATFVEVYFPQYKWLPVLGSPQQAKSSFSQQSQQDPNVAPSNDIAVRIFVPYETDPSSYLFQQIRAIVLFLLPFLLAVAAIYFLWPAALKAWLRSRRRAWAHDNGPGARIALAYSEWRDLCTDFGYRYTGDTPLMFLDRTVPDEEHAELAWLVTRTLWGDMRSELTESDADAAESLSRALRKRMGQAHPWTLRAVAALSRLSVREPYAPAITRLALAPGVRRAA